MMNEYIYQWVRSCYNYINRLMKESKIKSFLEMIKKVGCQAKEYESRELLKACAGQQGIGSEEPKQFEANINPEHGSSVIERNRLSLPPFTHKNDFGIYFTKETIKNRYEDKRSLYDLYRESLERKKNSFTSIP